MKHMGVRQYIIAKCDRDLLKYSEIIRVVIVSIVQHAMLGGWSGIKMTAEPGKSCITLHHSTRQFPTWL